jgi:hypothetical protein
MGSEWAKPEMRIVKGLIYEAVGLPRYIGLSTFQKPRPNEYHHVITSQCH